MPAMSPVKTSLPRTLVALAWSIAAGAAPAADDASGYPSRTVTIVVGFTPGGATDITARLLAGRLTQALGKPFIVENRPGADSNIGTEQVVRAKPDGHTLLMETIANATNMSAYKSLGYDTVRDLNPIVLVMTSPSVLVVTPSLPVKDLRSLIGLAKAQPGRLSFASSGTGGSTHLAGELLKLRAGLDLVHIPYKGAAPAMADVIAGHVSMGFMTSLGALAQMQSGQLRPIAVAHFKRLADLPQAVVDKLNAEVNKILALPDVQRQLQGLGAQAVGGSSRQFADHVQAQIQKWRDVVQAARITLD
jgi:tripartite-type tricarboxylate transporter receptor subunit TctC